MAKRQQLAPVVAVLNLKGGVGKTTISSNVFRVLFETYRASTLLLDLDPQYNLTQALFTRASYDIWRRKDKTIFAAMEPPSEVGLLEIATSSNPPPRPNQISKKLWAFHAKPEQRLAIVPGDFRLIKYSLMSENRKLEAVRDRFLKFVKMARQEFRVVCIDCNPSSSFFTLCALHACTHLLVPVRPDRYSILGLELLSDFVDNIPAIHPKPPITVVLNGVPRQEYDTTVENELRAHPVFGPRTLANVVHHSRILIARPAYTGFATDKPVPYRRTLTNEISRVANELATILGITK